MSTESNNGVESANALPESAPSVSTEQIIFDLLVRVEKLETDSARMKNAVIAAGEFMMKNPTTRAMISVLPKEAQTKLKEFFG